jgi:transcriptional regulator with XRE-family HTH domain
MRPARPEKTLGEFLRARRERVQPEEVGIMRAPGRRVPGLRREEVADLAGVSLDYYLRLEQGKASRPSDQVVAGLARALRLDPDGRRYLMKLAQPRPFMRIAQEQHTDDIVELLSQWSHMPAYISDANQNIVAVNALATALVPQLLVPGINHVVAAYDQYAAFMSRASEHGDRSAEEAAWEDTLRTITAALRFNGNPADPAFQEIVGLLTSRHPAFRRIWALHEARPQLNGRVSVHTEDFGWIDLSWQNLDAPGAADLYVTLLFAADGSRAAHALAQLSTKQGEAPMNGEGGEESAQPETDELDSRRAIAARPDSSAGTKTSRAHSS